MTHLKHALRWVPVGFYVAFTVLDTILGSIELPDVLIFAQLAVAGVILATIGHRAELVYRSES